MIKKIFTRARALFQKDKLERELDAELSFHLERETEENMRKGLSQSEARTAALRSFGGVEQVKEECRELRGVSLVENILQDARYGLRILLKNPGFTFVAVLTLALGIGANTAIFSVIYGVLMRPLPYENGSHLVYLRQQAPLAGLDNLGFSVKEIADYREQNRTLDEVVEYHTMSFILFGRQEPERVQVGVVSANFFDLLGVKPLHGRFFVEADEAHGAEATLILSYDYWKKSHGGDPSVVGQTFAMNNRPHTVIGILPQLPQYPNENDVYMPTSACPVRSSENFKANRNARMMSVFGKLKPGVHVAQAQADLQTIAASLQEQYPDSYPANRGYAAGVTSLQEELTRRARPTLLILFATAGLVLLIACANVANLTLARLMRREREIAVRAALGAGRGRLIRQLLTESTLLSLAGGVVGLAFAALGLNLLVTFAARFTTRAGEISIDGAVLLFTLVVSIVTGLAFGLMPAFTPEQNMLTALKEGAGRLTASKRRQQLRNALLVAQIAISFILLIGAGLMLRSFMKLQQVDPGFDPERVLAMRINLNWSKYTTPQQTRDFYNRLLERVKNQPGVLSVAAGSTYPMNPVGIAFGPFDRSFQIEGRPLAEGELSPRADFRVVSPDYFHTIRVPLVRGRTFTDMDNEKSLNVAVINQAMARHRWGDEDPIGKRVSFDGGQNWITIVGIVGDIKQYGLGSEVTDEFYRPLAQNPGGGNLLVRTAADPLNLARQLRDTIHAVEPEAAIDNVHTLEEVRNESIASPRLTAMLLAIFAALALVITATGIAGVMALSVTQRTHEIGLRMALGASPARMLAMVMRQGMVMVVAGLAIGVVGAMALTQLMSNLLFAVEPTDPVTFFAVLMVLVGVAGAACFVPARRATTIDPMIALRSE